MLQSDVLHWPFIKDSTIPGKEQAHKGTFFTVVSHPFFIAQHILAILRIFARFGISGFGDISLYSTIPLGTLFPELQQQLSLTGFKKHQQRESIQSVDNVRMKQSYKQVSRLTEGASSGGDMAGKHCWKRLLRIFSRLVGNFGFVHKMRYGHEVCLWNALCDQSMAGCSMIMRSVESR
eukprot:1904355-Amphidinium_carterae.1